jgi:carboxyl-terminal processing protease
MRQKNSRLDITLYILIAALMTAGAFASGYFTRVIAERREDKYPLLTEVQSLLETKYLGQLPPGAQLQYGAVRGLVSAVGDPYTVFLEPPAQELESQSLAGEFGGIGVALSRNEAGDVVLTAYPDLPAARAGVQSGDLLIEIGGAPVERGESPDDISARIRGPVGSKVTISVRRGGDADTMQFTLTREAIELPSVTGSLLEQHPTIGLVTISRFSGKTPSEVRQTAQDLQSQGATMLILDLRGNGGGLLQSAIDTAGLFLDGGVVMHEKRRGEDEKTFSAPAAGPLADMKLVILVNHGTASAAEILAGALRDRGRGPLIGQQTYGKGSVQLVFTLSDNSSVHVTNARWYTPDHIVIDGGVGLKPDIELQPGTDGSDPELARAITYLESLP